MGGIVHLFLTCLFISAPNVFAAFSAMSPPSDFFGQNGGNSAFDFANNPSFLGNNIASKVNSDLDHNMQGIGQNLFRHNGNAGSSRPRAPPSHNSRGGLGALNSDDLSSNIGQTIHDRMDGLNKNLFSHNNKKPDHFSRNNQNTQKGTDDLNHGDRNSNNNREESVREEDTEKPTPDQRQGSKPPQTNQRNNNVPASNSQNQGSKRNTSGNQKSPNKEVSKPGPSANNQSPKWSAYGKTTTKTTAKTTRKPSTRRNDPEEDE